MFILLRKKAGMSLVEVVIAAAVVLLLSSILISVNVTYKRTASINLKTVKAIYLVEEGIEAVNFLKDIDWNNLGVVNTDYYLVQNNKIWIATTTKNYIDSLYVRKFYTESVNRDASDDIVLTGGSLDSNTRKLIVQVSWNDNYGTTTKSISSYITK